MYNDNEPQIHSVIFGSVQEEGYKSVGYYVACHTCDFRHQMTMYDNMSIVVAPQDAYAIMQQIETIGMMHASGQWEEQI